MMRNILITVIFSFLLLTAVFQVTAQSSQGASNQALNMTGAPQWAKDLRRWDIIAFGSFPFTMFAVTFFTDLARWNNANNLDFSAEGRRYAPWPFKAAGAVEMSKEEYERTILIAAGLSVAIAVTDLIIVKIKERKERRRIESAPSGSVIINMEPLKASEENGETLSGADNTGRPVIE